MIWYEFVALLEFIYHTFGILMLNMLLPVLDFQALFTPSWFYHNVKQNWFIAILMYIGYFIFVPIYGVFSLIKIIIEGFRHYGR